MILGRYDQLFSSEFAKCSPLTELSTFATWGPKEARLSILPLSKSHFQYPHPSHPHCLSKGGHWILCHLHHVFGSYSEYPSSIFDSLVSVDESIKWDPKPSDPTGDDSDAGDFHQPWIMCGAWRAPPSWGQGLEQSYKRYKHLVGEVLESKRDIAVLQWLIRACKGFLKNSKSHYVLKLTEIWLSGFTNHASKQTICF